MIEVEPEPEVAASLFRDSLETARSFAAHLVEFGDILGLIGPAELGRLWSRHLLNSVILSPLIWPDATVADILWEQASKRLTRGDGEDGRALYAEYIRRKTSSTVLDDQLKVAHAYIRLDYARAASEAIARVKATAKERTTLARVRNAEHDRKKYDRRNKHAYHIDKSLAD